MAVPSLRRLLRSSTRATCALLFALGAGALAVVAGTGRPARGRRRLRLSYLAHGSAWPLLSAVLHTRVDAAHRATAVSAMSLAQALGGVAGNLAVPALAAALGTGAAFLGVAGVVLAGALACLRLPRRTIAVPVPAAA